MALPDASSPPHRRSRLLRPPKIRDARPEDWRQLVRFCVVGASGYVVNLAVFSALVAGADTHYTPAAVAAFAVAWTSNFVLNKQWTFRVHGRTWFQQGWRNLAVSLVGLGLNLVLLALLVAAGLGEIPAQMVAIAAVTPFSFLLNRRWSFR